jgi:hypothetical protein
MKDPFVMPTLMKDPFINTERAPHAKRWAQAHNPRVLPAIPSTWRSPITPCQGGQCTKHDVAKPGLPHREANARAPLARCDST